jgi:hypothetical protein
MFNHPNEYYIFLQFHSKQDLKHIAALRTIVTSHGRFPDTDTRFPMYVRVDPETNEAISRQSDIDNCSQEFKDYYYNLGIPVEQFIYGYTKQPYEFW